MTNLRSRHGRHPPREHIDCSGLHSCCLETMDKSLVLEEHGEIIQCKTCKREIKYNGKEWKLKP